MDTYAVKWSQELVEELIMHYQAHENLYTVTDPSYLDKAARTNSLKEIMIELKKLNKDITVPIIKSKINTIRSQYLKELRRVQWSKKNGAKEVYKPRLWFYDILNFLKPNCKAKPGRAHQYKQITVPQFEDVTIDEEEIVESFPSNVVVKNLNTNTKQNFETSKKRLYSNTSLVHMDIEPHYSDSQSKPVGDQHPSFKPARRAAFELAIKELKAIVDRLSGPSDVDCEFECFGRLIVCILRQLPPAEAQAAMAFIQQDLVERRLKFMGM